ncbi:efflux RND transporter periplasmic adaptor subunit [Candidatus Sumerlaeota bacterium]|nr:efflux RND transporter periplasmic adaptor subunit [Candidatus Sumerlaeota bacterium]
MRKVAIRIALLFVVAAVVAGVWHRRGRERGNAGGDLVLYGNVDIREVELAFNGAQRLASVRVEEGDRVTSGQLLATLESTRLEDAVAGAEALVAQQDQILAALEAGSRPEEIRKAKADVEAARAQAANAERTWQRLRVLARQDANSQQQADDARAAADGAQAQLQAVQESLHLAEAGPRREDIEAARAALEAARATLSLRRRELADAHLYAPAPGVVRDRLLEPGSMVTPQTPVFTLALDRPVWVRAYVAEGDLGKLKPGMKARVETDSYPDKSYSGWIGFISPTAEFTPKSVETTETRTRLVYQVRAFVDDPRDELRLGMPATVVVSLDHPNPPDERDRSSSTSP